LTRKTGQADLFLASDQGSLVGLGMQVYKSLCAAATICATLVNIQTYMDTHKQHFDQLIMTRWSAIGLHSALHVKRETHILPIGGLYTQILWDWGHPLPKCSLIR